MCSSLYAVSTKIVGCTANVVPNKQDQTGIISRDKSGVKLRLGGSGSQNTIHLSASHTLEMGEKINYFVAAVKAHQDGSLKGSAVN